MKKLKFALSGIITVFFLIFFLKTEQINATGGGGACNWGYSEVTTHWWPPNNNKRSKYCDCSDTGDFQSGSSCASNPDS